MSSERYADIASYSLIGAGNTVIAWFAGLDWGALTTGMSAAILLIGGAFIKILNELAKMRRDNRRLDEEAAKESLTAKLDEALADGKRLRQSNHDILSKLQASELRHINEMEQREESVRLLTEQLRIATDQLRISAGQHTVLLQQQTTIADNVAGVADKVQQNADAIEEIRSAPSEKNEQHS